MQVPGHPDWGYIDPAQSPYVNEPELENILKTNVKIKTHAERSVKNQPMLIEMTPKIARRRRKVGIRNTPSAGGDVSKVVLGIEWHGVLLVPGPKPYAYSRQGGPLHGVPSTPGSGECGPVRVCTARADTTALVEVDVDVAVG